MTWKHYVTIIGGLVATGTIISAASPLMHSDSPPFAGTMRVDDLKKDIHITINDAKNEVRADLYKNRIMQLRRDRCTARDAKNYGLMNAVDEQLSEAEGTYMQITGLTVVLNPCPGQ